MPRGVQGSADCTFMASIKNVRVETRDGRFLASVEDCALPPLPSEEVPGLRGAWAAQAAEAAALSTGAASHDEVVRLLASGCPLSVDCADASSATVVLDESRADSTAPRTLRAIRAERSKIFTESELGPDPPVYMDYNATTPIDPAVREVMIAQGLTIPCNPASNHAYGMRARRLLAEARKSLAGLINAEDPDTLVFLSCGTEANNWAIRGCVDAWWRAKGRDVGDGDASPVVVPNVVTLSIEHLSTVKTCKLLSEGAAVGRYGSIHVRTIGVNSLCIADPSDVAAAVDENTCLVTVMLANNEVGAIQHVAEMVRLIRACEAKTAGSSVAVHVDASQAIGKIPVDVQELGADYLTIAGHKLYSATGCGALYISSSARWGVPRSYLLGAPQEGGRRAGTVSLALCAALGKASELAGAYLAGGGREKLFALRSRLVSRLRIEAECVGTEPPVVNGPDTLESVLPNTVSLSVRGIHAAELFAGLNDKIAGSMGAACASIDGHLSGVVAAMGMAPDLAMGTIRLSFGKFTTASEVDFVAHHLVNRIATMRGVLAAEPTVTTAPTIMGLYQFDTDITACRSKVLDASPVSATGDVVLNGEEVPLKGLPEDASAVIVLEQTVAHPQGGGQPADKGRLVWTVLRRSMESLEPERVLVAAQLVHVVKSPLPSGEILHVVGPPSVAGPLEMALPTPGASVLTTLDAEWRAQSARLHSAGHLLDAAMRKLVPSLTPGTGYHFPDRPSVNYSGSVEGVDLVKLTSDLQVACDALIAAGAPTSTTMAHKGDTALLAGLGISPDMVEHLPDDATVRVVAVGDAENVCPCGGTHVKDAGQLEGLRILSIKSKKGQTKVSYTFAA
jgi:cysteine desulfurase